MNRAGNFLTTRNFFLAAVVFVDKNSRHTQIKYVQIPENKSVVAPKKKVTRCRSSSHGTNR